MNWKLIFTLSLSGLLMGVLTSFVVTSEVEMYVWIPIMLIIAYFVAKQASGKYFLHGFLTSVFSGFWLLLVHALLWDNFYALNKVSMDADFAGMPQGFSMKVIMLAVTPFVGAFFGLIQGLLAFLASKIVKK
ncbi:MAG: hypothetical protein ACOVMI_04000 [Chitinophagaceae bacterium]